MKYSILWDYNTEGFKFDDKKFATISGAVEYAVSLSYSARFLIVQIIEWEAKPKDETEV